MAKQNEPIGPGGRVPIPNMRKGVSQFLKEVGIEMRRVIWPTRAETVRLTSAVLFVCVLFIVYLYVAGIIVENIVRLLEGTNPGA